MPTARPVLPPVLAVRDLVIFLYDSGSGLGRLSADRRGSRLVSASRSCPPVQA